jgi:hypothetical protein
MLLVAEGMVLSTYINELSLPILTSRRGWLFQTVQKFVIFNANILYMTFHKTVHEHFRINLTENLRKASNKAVQQEAGTGEDGSSRRTCCRDVSTSAVSKRKK